MPRKAEKQGNVHALHVARRGVAPAELAPLLTQLMLPMVAGMVTLIAQLAGLRWDSDQDFCVPPAHVRERILVMRHAGVATPPAWKPEFDERSPRPT